MPPKIGPKDGRQAAHDGSSAKIWIVIGGVVVIAIVAVVLSVPAYVKRKCIETAAAEGITLGIGSAQIGLGEVHLGDVTFAIDDVPQLHGVASDVDVTLSGLTPQAVVARGVGITIDGPAEEVDAAVDKWRAAHVKPKGRASEAIARQQKLSVQSGHLTWTRAFGQTAKIDASDLSAETDATGASFHMTAEKTLVSTPKGDAGPWRLTFERDAQSARTRFDLDPALRDGPSVLYVKTPGGVTSIKVNVPKSPLARIGLPPTLFGLPAGQSTVAEATIDLERTTPQHAELKTHVALFAARLGGAPVPVDVKLDFAAAGDPAKQLDVSKGSLTVGPFQASVTGTMHMFADGARLSLAWRTQPLKCEEAMQSMAKEAFGDLGAQLGAFAQGLGTSLTKLGVDKVAKVTGEAHASCLLTIDSRDLNDVSFTMTANDTCGIAIFP